jgi:hypothetical protein
LRFLEEERGSPRRLRFTMYRVWHGIVSTRVPGMTASQASQREPAAAQSAVPLQSLQRIGRAGGMKAAVHAQHRAQRVSVSAYQEAEQILHGSLATSSAIAARGCSGVAVTRTRRSRLPKRTRFCRNHSRNTRFSRLRSTARATTRFGMMKPSRARPAVFALAWIAKPPRRSGRPDASSARISFAPSLCLLREPREPLKRPGAPDLWRGERGSLPGLHAYAYVRGNRGCASCGPRTVDRCVSFGFSLKANRTLN